MSEQQQTAAELLESSQRLRDNLMTAVGKLDSYIEQLKAVSRETHTDEHTRT